MSLKIYCIRYAHFKDVRVCSFNCAYRARCRDFALFYDDNRAETDAAVAAYIATRRTESEKRPANNSLVTITNVSSLLKLEVKREMTEIAYIWVDKDDHAELLTTEEVLRRAERGAKAKHIYKVSQEMELRYQLVPRRGIEKAKRLAAAEQEAARARRSRLRAVASEKEMGVPTVESAPPVVMPSAAKRLREPADVVPPTPVKRKSAAARRLPTAKAVGER